MHIKIVKLGGAATSQKGGFENIPAIFRDSSKYAVVVSAFGKTTRMLADAAYSAANGTLDSALSMLEIIFDFHFALLNSVGFRSENLDKKLNLFKNDLHNLIESIAVTNELTPRILDKVMSFGELIALEIIFDFLEHHNLSVKKVNSTDIFITDNNYNRANLNYEKTINNINKFLKPDFDLHDIIIIQGFTASAVDGTQTTMGIESSNLTATVLAVTLKCDEINIYSDVEGIRSLDPKMTARTESVPLLNYNDSLTAASNGLKLIYPQMINEFFAEDAQNKRIIYRSLLIPQGDKTIISGELSNPKPLIIVENDYYISEFQHNNNKKSLNILQQILNEHYGFIKDINLSSGKLTVSSWEKIKINNEIIDFPELSIIKILFIDKEYEEKLLKILKNYHVSEWNFNYQLKLATVKIDANSAEKLADELHKSLYD